MDRRILNFILMVFLIIAINNLVWNWIKPPAPQPVPPAVAEKGEDVGEDAAGEEENVAPEKSEGETPEEQPQPPEVAAPEEAPAEQIDQEFLTLGSLDPKSEYEMLVTFTNRGAAVVRAEMNSPQSLDLESKHAYIGQLELKDSAEEPGAMIQVVGPGTPAAEAGLEVGEVITEVNGKVVTSAVQVEESLKKIDAEQVVKLKVGQREVSVTSRRAPLQVISAEEGHLSLEMALQRLGEKKLDFEDDHLPGVDLKDVHWQVDAKADLLRFTRKLPDQGLTIAKDFSLASGGVKDAQGRELPAYHLDVALEIASDAEEEQTVAYRLAGPNGLPTEGHWYAMKVSPYWSSVGIRDIVWKVQGISQTLIAAKNLADEEVEDESVRPEVPLEYVGVDAQYFATVLLPKRAEDAAQWIDEVQAVRVGEAPKEKAEYNLTNVTFRVLSKPARLSADSGPLRHEFKLFVGPKKPDMLAEYGLGNLVYYGWFGFVARPMVALLNVFYAIIPNYGIAIILLTVLVRSLMFPISRQQALNAQKMQVLQPEMKKLNEKYKNEPEKRMKAMQDLYRKHNFNPMAGCLPMVLQLPIFVGLYRALAVDVELRQAPLIPGVDWASNLAAPDMLFDWSNVMPGFVTGWLGPYFNLLPILTIILFLVQQKMMMPPPADEQAAMQQKMMKYMMLFIGLMFFRVPSGLCLYFIASSLWGVAERKLLPKTQTTDDAGRPVQEKKEPVESKVGKFIGMFDKDESQRNGSGDAAKKKRKRSK